MTRCKMIRYDTVWYGIFFHVTVTDWQPGSHGNDRCSELLRGQRIPYTQRLTEEVRQGKRVVVVLLSDVIDFWELLEKKETWSNEHLQP